jgi:hypothetical protein
VDWTVGYKGFKGCGFSKLRNKLYDCAQVAERWRVSPAENSSLASETLPKDLRSAEHATRLCTDNGIPLPNSGTHHGRVVASHRGRTLFGRTNSS